MPWDIIRNFGEHQTGIPMRSNAVAFARLLSLGILCLSTAAMALGWGPEGHRIVAVIAEMNLTPRARAQVSALLGPDNSMAAISSWADDTRVDFPQTAPWHYIDIPLDATTIDMASECPLGNCVVAQIEKFEAVLKNPHAKEADRRIALEFLVHFVGDLHQPLHCEDNHDRGGNQVTVSFFGGTENLHAVWDTGILSRDDPNPESLAVKMGNTISDANKSQWAQGRVEDWALESHKISPSRLLTRTSPAARRRNSGKVTTTRRCRSRRPSLRKPGSGLRLS
jgi:nuclease S1